MVKKVLVEVAKVSEKPKVKMVSTKNGLVEVPIKVEESKALRFDSRKFVRVQENEGEAKFKEMGDRIMRKELKWAYYTTENNIGTHYYTIINTGL